MSPGKFWYHGTVLEYSMRISDGIDLDYGHLCKDFSHGYGFYLNKLKKGACIFALSKTTCFKSAPAVVIYREPKSLKTYDCLNLCKDEEDWKQIIRYNRGGQLMPLHEIDANLYNQFKASDYCVGPIFHRNKDDVSDVAGFKYHYRQLCIRNEYLAKEFNDNLYKIICLQDNKWVVHYSSSALNNSFRQLRIRSEHLAEDHCKIMYKKHCRKDQEWAQKILPWGTAPLKSGHRRSYHGALLL